MTLDTYACVYIGRHSTTTSKQVVSSKDTCALLLLKFSSEVQLRHRFVNYSSALCLLVLAGNPCEYAFANWRQ